jgi:hypothetical protein
LSLDVYKTAQPNPLIGDIKKKVAAGEGDADVFAMPPISLRLLAQN